MTLFHMKLIIALNLNSNYVVSGYGAVAVMRHDPMQYGYWQYKGTCIFCSLSCQV